MPTSEIRSSGTASESVQLFSSRSDDYARFRPTYPEALFAWLADQCATTDIALDLAAGNGQASFPLTRYFRRVLACDASAEQLSAANDWPDVQRFVADANTCPCKADGSTCWWSPRHCTGSPQRIFSPRRGSR